LIARKQFNRVSFSTKLIAHGGEQVEAEEELAKATWMKSLG
jgi:hypothetical protein